MNSFYDFFSEQFKLKDEYRTKEEMTLWQYELSQNPKYLTLKKDSAVEVLDCSTKWWKVKHKVGTGYASRYHFEKKLAKSYERKDWYFGELPREECEKALNKGINKEGSFLVRCKKDLNRSVFILSVKHNKHRKETQTSQINHFEVDVDEKGKFSICEKRCERYGKRFTTLEDMISHHQETPHYGT
jgi:hypothetical protein